MDILILTGMSGAGKSHAAHSLEDAGYFCVDNMPAVIMPEFINIYKRIPDKNQMVAFVIDVRGEDEFNTLLEQVVKLKAEHRCKLLFLDCSDETIITRYKETRRIHPLTAIKNLPVRDAIIKERELLRDARERSDFVIDTTKLTVYQLKERITALTNKNENGSINIGFMSFGFKYGVPSEADLVFDVRCFPNPFYIESMREKTGLDAEVSDYVLSHEETIIFIEKLNDIISYLLPLYVNEGRSQLIVAIGCTGGKHRSVSICELMKKYFIQKNYNTSVIHRDIKKN